MTDPVESVATLAELLVDDAAELARRHRGSLFPRVRLFSEEPIEQRRGEGQYVYGGAGRQYLDFFGGIATVSSRHAIPEINDPITAQLDHAPHLSPRQIHELRLDGFMIRWPIPGHVE